MYDDYEDHVTYVECDDEEKQAFCDAWRDLQEQEGWVSI